MRGDFSNILLTYLKKFRELHIEKRRFACIVMVLALMVAGSVVWRLKYTGIAMTNETFCGIEEHTHTEDCYERELVCGMEDDEGHVHTDECYEEQQVLICDIEEGVPHEHTEECTELVLVCGEEESEGHEHTDECYDEDGELICGLEEEEGHEHTEECYETRYICGLEEGEAHIHTDECYETQRVLICGEEERAGHVHQEECYREVLVCEKEEHIHTIACLSNEAADVEDKSDWIATLPELSGIERKDVVAIAESQMGYTESEANFEVDDEGEVRGYTRYGAWYGNRYGKWDAMFVSFCLYYAKVSESEFPQAAGVYAWKAELASLGLYESAEDYVPLEGDVIFFDSDGDSRADRAGVVVSVDCEGEMLYIVEGDCETDDGDAVCENEYSLFDEKIMGYGVLPYDEYVEEEEYTIEMEVVTEAVTEEAEAANEEVTEVIIEETPTEAVSEEATEKAGEESTETALAAALTANLTAKAYNKTFEGEDYIVMVSYGEDAEIPDEAELVVSEYDKNSEVYLARYAEAAELYGWDVTEEEAEEGTEAGISEASEDEEDEEYEEETEAASAVEFRLFNIEFVADGEVIEPAAEVKVMIIYLDREEAAECSVMHFSDNAEAVEMDVEVEYEDGVQMIAFDTDGFSDYGITLMSVVSDTSDLVTYITDVSELDGQSFAILSSTMNYGMLTTAITGSSSGLRKSSVEDGGLLTLPQWTFELVSGSGTSGTFYIYYEDDSGTKNYLQMTRSGNTTYFKTVTGENNATAFTVDVNQDGSIYAYISVTTTQYGQTRTTKYYISQYNGDNGNVNSGGFRGANATTYAKLYLFQWSEAVDEFDLTIYNKSGNVAYSDTIGDAVKYLDEDNAVWYLIPIGYFTDALTSDGFTFDSSGTALFEYAPDATALTSKEQAQYIQYNGSWYVAVQDTTGGSTPQSNVYYNPNISTTLTLTDNIINDGTFVAGIYVDGVEVSSYDGYTFTWYKSESGEDGTFEQVTDESVMEANTINVAEDDGGLCYYYYTVTLPDGSVMTSDVLQVPYASRILNGSFEDPQWTDTSGQHLEETIPYWSTTASDNLIEIGRYDADVTTYGATGTGSEDSGEQFAELNAARASALYQDVLTAEGEMLYWSFSHRARNATGSSSFVGTQSTSTVSTGTNSQTVTTTYTATDTMYVVIMSASDAEKLLAGVSDANQQTVLTNMITSVLDGEDYNSDTYQLVTGTYSGETVTATIQTVTTTSTLSVVEEQTYSYGRWTTQSTEYEYSSWVTYSGEYEVPDGQYLTRFFFVAGNTHSGDNTMGNLIDNISFSQEIPYTIEYWVYNSTTGVYDLVETDTETGSVDVYTWVSASKMDQYAASYALVDSIVGTASGGSNPDESEFDDPTRSTMKVQTGTTYMSLYFSNEGITIIKTLEGFSEAQLEEIAAAKEAVFTFHVEGGTGTNAVNRDVTITLGEEGTGSTYVYAASSAEGITYTITETGYALKLLDGTYGWVSVSPSETQEVTLTTTSSAATVEFTNRYERVITLLKISSSSAATPLDGAEFVIYKVENEVKYYYTDTETWSDDISDAATFTTGTDGMVTITGLDDGTYYLSEVKAPDGYIPLSKEIGFTLSGGTITILDTTDPASADGLEITVTNKPGEIMPSTGSTGAHLPIILGALMVLAALTVMFKNKRGEGDVT